MRYENINLPDTKNRTNKVKAIAPCSARSSAEMVLTLHNKHVIVFNGEGFQLPVPSQRWEMIKDSMNTYRQTSNISHSLVDNKLVDHSDVVGASPVGAAPTTSSFST